MNTLHSRTVFMEDVTEIRAVGRQAHRMGGAVTRTSPCTHHGVPGYAVTVALPWDVWISYDIDEWLGTNEVPDTTAEAREVDRMLDDIHDAGWCTIPNPWRDSRSYTGARAPFADRDEAVSYIRGQHARLMEG